MTNSMDNGLLDPQKHSGPVTVRNMTYYVDRDLCIGAATCVAIAPKIFLMDSDAKAVILSSAAEDSDETLLDSARGCPVAAIIIHNEKGEKVYPR